MLEIADRPRILVTDGFPGPAVDDLRSQFSVDVWLGGGSMPRVELLERIRGCVGLISTLNDAIDAELLDAGTALRVIGTVAAGYDNIDIDACRLRNVVVCNTPGVLTDATADMTLALMLAAARRLPEGVAAARDGTWGRWNPTWLTGLELRDATLGVVGFGEIGRAVAQRATAFGMQVIYHGRSSGVPLDELLQCSDVVTLHCPLNPATTGLIGAAELEMMRPSTLLVNTARGRIIDQDALLVALRNGTIGGAALDVTTPEPLPVDHPLLSLPNCIVTPHLGSATHATRARMTELAVAGVREVLQGRRPTNTV